jgi:hypothetical protein
MLLLLVAEAAVFPGKSPLPDFNPLSFEKNVGEECEPPVKLPF